MTFPGLLLPNDEQVGIAWCRLYVGPELGDAGIASNLPKTLPGDGFVQIRSLRPGIADIDLPTHHSLLTFDFWAAPANGGAHPRWSVAAQLVARVTRAMENRFQTFNKELGLGADYIPARVQAVYKDNEPRRVPDDPSGYARFTLDVNVDWLVLA